MKSQIIQKNQIFLILFLAISLPATISAQIISLKTVPVATGDQFLIFPSQNLGMGGVSIALDDPWLDPFVNPAKGMRTSGAMLFSSPTIYNISDDNGSARTVPFGTLFGLRNWFGALSVSIQQLKMADPSGIQPAWRDPTPLSAKFSNNTYAFGSLGKRLSDAKTAIAGSIFWASLNGIDGVDLLYPRSQKIEQFGDILDLRLGLLRELGGERSFEALLLHNRFNMTHDVTYANWDWFGPWSTPRSRVERNLDHSRTWGLHVGYTQPFLHSDWRIGGILSGNWKTHPKIPNYELMNIPRDPGNSWAYNFGLGVSKSVGTTSFGIDFIYEPIWSNTWADAASQVESRSGRIIRAGAKTVENDFRFSNAMFRLGISNESDRAGFQLGCQVRSIRYLLDQYNYIEEFRRKQRENWLEWTFSWGLLFKFSEFQMRYFGRMILGTGRPGVAWSRVSPMEEGAFIDYSRADFILAPSGDLTLDDAVVFTQQISILIPIGTK